MLDIIKSRLGKTHYHQMRSHAASRRGLSEAMKVASRIQKEETETLGNKLGTFYIEHTMVNAVRVAERHLISVFGDADSSELAGLRSLLIGMLICTSGEERLIYAIEYMAMLTVVLRRKILSDHYDIAKNVLYVKAKGNWIFKKVSEGRDPRAEEVTWTYTGELQSGFSEAIEDLRSMLRWPLHGCWTPRIEKLIVETKAAMTTVPQRWSVEENEKITSFLHDTIMV